MTCQTSCEPQWLFLWPSFRP